MEKDGNYYMEGILDDVNQMVMVLRTVNYSKGKKIFIYLLAKLF